MKVLAFCLNANYLSETAFENYANEILKECAKHTDLEEVKLFLLDNINLNHHGIPIENGKESDMRKLERMLQQVLSTQRILVNFVQPFAGLCEVLSKKPHLLNYDVTLAYALLHLSPNVKKMHFFIDTKSFESLYWVMKEAGSYIVPYGMTACLMEHQQGKVARSYVKKGLGERVANLPMALHGMANTCKAFVKRDAKDREREEYIHFARNILKDYCKVGCKQVNYDIYATNAVSRFLLSNSLFYVPSPEFQQERAEMADKIEKAQALRKSI